MNASPVPGSSKRLVGSIIVLILALVALYYLYDYLYNTTQLVVKADLLGGAQVSSPGTTIFYPVAGTSPSSAVNLSQYIFTGGTMSLSFWIYVTAPPAGNSLGHIVSLGTSTDNLLVVALGSTTNNSLVVKVKDSSTAIPLDVFLNNSTNSSPSTPCNIKNFELGRWVNVVVVLNNNLVDVYTDGKLSRSSVLSGPFTVPTATATEPLKFKMLPVSVSSTSFWAGSLSGVSFFNMAISPADVYNIYMAGPSGSQGDLWSKVKSIFGQLEDKYTKAVSA